MKRTIRSKFLIKPKIKRNEMIVTLKEAGYSYNALAKRFQVTPQRIYNIIQQHQKRKKTAEEKLKPKTKEELLIEINILRKEKKALMKEVEQLKQLKLERLLKRRKLDFNLEGKR